MARRESVGVESLQDEVLAGEVRDRDHLKVRVIDSRTSGNLVSSAFPGTGTGTGPGQSGLLPVETLLQLLQQSRLQLLQQGQEPIC